MNDNEHILPSDPRQDDSYLRAMQLHRLAEANLHSAAVSLAEVGRCLKQIRDEKLYKALGCETLEAYTEVKLGIRRSQAYKMIQITEKLPEEFVQSTGRIGIEKLALLALTSPEEREELQEQIDLETITVKELKAKVKELEQNKSVLIDDIKRIAADRDEAKAALSSKDRQFQAAMESKDKLAGQIRSLTSQVAELESRPIEHEFQEVPDPKQQKKIEELTARLRQNEAEYTQRLKASEREYAERVRVIEQELSQAKAQAAGTAVTVDTKGVFKAYLAAAADAMTRVFAYLESIPDDGDRALYLEKLDGMLSMASDRRNAL